MMSSPPRDSRIFTNTFKTWDTSVSRLLEAAGLAEQIPPGKAVLIKPNLVEPLKPPITTPVELVAALIDYLKKNTPATKIMIGEGCGSMEHDTMHIFEVLGYTDLAQRKNVELIDLNQAPLRRLTNEQCRRWPEMYLPDLVFENFLISVPVLKAHSLAGVTLTMKNMMGLAPPTHYQQGGHWKKAAFHDQIQEAVSDLNCYRTADFTLLDATVGMPEAHLWGPTCSPPINRLAAGRDPVALDAYGCRLLKRRWQDIGHIRLAHNKLGTAEPLEIIEVAE